MKTGRCERTAVSRNFSSTFWRRPCGGAEKSGKRRLCKCLQQQLLKWKASLDAFWQKFDKIEAGDSWEKRGKLIRQTYSEVITALNTRRAQGLLPLEGRSPHREQESYFISLRESESSFLPVRCRYAPFARSPSFKGPIATRTILRTLIPKAASSRRIWRFFPSSRTISSQQFRVPRRRIAALFWPRGNSPSSSGLPLFRFC